MEIRFGEDGFISGIRVDARGAMVDGETVMMAWEGRFSDYRPVECMLIPFHGAVGRVTPKGERTCFLGTVSRVTYDLTRRGAGPTGG